MSILTLEKIESLILAVFSENEEPLSFLELVDKVQVKSKTFSLSDIKIATLDLIETDMLSFTKNRKIQKNHNV